MTHTHVHTHTYGGNGRKSNDSRLKRKSSVENTPLLLYALVYSSIVPVCLCIIYTVSLCIITQFIVFSVTFTLIFDYSSAFLYVLTVFTCTSYALTSSLTTYSSPLFSVYLLLPGFTPPLFRLSLSTIYREDLIGNF